MQPDKDRTVTLYNGTIQIKFVESNHSYWIREKVPIGQQGEPGWTSWKRVSGSTTIIGIMDKSAALVGWATKIAKRYLNAILLTRSITIYDITEACGLHKVKKESAATSGSLVHDYLEAHVKGLNPPYPDQPLVAQGVESFFAWKAANNVHIIGSETLLYSKKYHYCGQADFIFYKDNPQEIYLGDYKTSNGLYTGVMMQTASYLKGIEEMGLVDAEWTDKAWLASVDLTQVKFVGRYALRLEKRTEEEFQRDMEEKGLLDTPYQIFEYINLDPEPWIDADFAAFLDARGLRNWNLDAEKRIKEYRKII